MRKLIFRRLHGDQSGVTMVIVALCLIALMGMIVLVVDVGGLLWNRRAMVNASDAAALSAAKSCVLPASMDPQTPEQAADALAADNSSGADVSNPNNIIQSSGCDSADTGYVTVRYGANQQLFFAGIFGKGQGHVTTQATAIWGPAGAANPMPIVIYQNSFQTCQFDQIDPNKTCYVWEDNTNTSPGSAFGLLDLRTDNPSKYGWNSNAGAGCTNPGSLIDQWITQYPDNSVGDLPLNYPNPTYVCRVSGMAQSVWADFANLKGQTLYFPINRCDTVLARESRRAAPEELNERGDVRNDARPVRHHRVLRGEADQRVPPEPGIRWLWALHYGSDLPWTEQPVHRVFDVRGEPNHPLPGRAPRHHHERGGRQGEQEGSGSRPCPRYGLHRGLFEPGRPFDYVDNRWPGERESDLQRVVRLGDGWEVWGSSGQQLRPLRHPATGAGADRREPSWRRHRKRARLQTV